MKHPKVLGFACGMALVGAGPINTAVADGFYVAVQAGPSIRDNADIDVTNLGTPISLEADHDTGFSVSGSFGYAWNKGPRLEAEVSYSRHDLNTITLDSIGGTPIGIGRPRI